VVDMPQCPKCNAELDDVGNYKWDCPNECFPTSLELWQMENEENMNNSWIDKHSINCIVCNALVDERDCVPYGEGQVCPDCESKNPDIALANQYSDWKGVDWVEPNIQFPRLLSEIWHSGEFDLKKLSEEMDLTETGVIEIFERALREWEKIKQDM